ncbi:hypothetical protein G7046_g1415 [Stylonectria norvegica]|nr:hypothetical protein G7046_g1415 [Stylonectria norvegica]
MIGLAGCSERTGYSNGCFSNNLIHFIRRVESRRRGQLGMDNRPAHERLRRGALLTRRPSPLGFPRDHPVPATRIPVCRSIAHAKHACGGIEARGALSGACLILPRGAVGAVVRVTMRPVSCLGLLDWEGGLRNGSRRLALQQGTDWPAETHVLQMVGWEDGAQTQTAGTQLRHRQLKSWNLTGHSPTWFPFLPSICCIYSISLTSHIPSPATTSLYRCAALRLAPGTRHHLSEQFGDRSLRLPPGLLLSPPTRTPVCCRAAVLVLSVARDAGFKVHFLGLLETARSSRSSQPPPAANPTPRYSAQSNNTSSVFSRTSASSALTAQSCDDSHSTDPEPESDRNYRDSFVSIVDDPFFQRYDPALAAAHAASEPSDESSNYQSIDDEEDEDKDDHYEHQDNDSDDNIPKQRWPPPRRESLIAGPSSYWSQSSSDMEGYNIAVIGSTGVGKSSFVQRVLGLSRPPISNASSVRMVVDNVTQIITLLELDLEYFELNPAQPIQWPKQVNGHIVPRVDAALILYDVMNQESIRELPQALATLTHSGLPACLVACKCENPEDDWEVDADQLASHKLFKSCVSAYKVSSEKPEVAKACLQTILRAAISHRRENGETVSRRRAQSAANLDALDPSAGRPMSQQSKHSRASSDFSLLRGFPNPPITENYRTQSSRSPNIAQQQSANVNSSSASDSDQGQPQTVNSMLRTPGIRLDKPGTDSFLDVEESDTESFRYSDDIPILQRNDDTVLDKPVRAVGVSFEELVDRLLAPRLSRADNNFSDIFLCLYRKFAAPGELFSAILTRLDRVRDDKTAHYLSKTATQLRIIEVVDKWVSLYPGDFARPMTRRNLEEFIKHLSTEPIFSIAAQHMRRNLHLNVVEDDDTGWANSDDKGDMLASEILSKEMSELSAGVTSLQFDEDPNGRPSASSEQSVAERGNTTGSQFQFHSYDEYEREASLLEPTENLPMNKFRYHIFMDIPDDDVADELTRIDWIMFSSIRIRDFVRHVSLSAVQKEKCKSLRNVNRMIYHFNHVAKWVANMILLRDKAKHRAQILDKFMTIALKLRLLNNYNGLAAVLAGINGTAIHRLAQTRSLVSAETHKRFARLVILMGTQKSHFAYRLAWENSPLPRIPFIPLHRRDLVSAEEGSKTFVGAEGDRINWKKFEVLGEVLLPIMKSQGTAYPNLAKHDTARELILGCRMPTDDEDIYQRSVQVESGSGGLAEPPKKKFPWFANSK